MNLAHVHIILNHIPSLGCIAALVLLAAAMYTRNEGLKKFSFIALVMLALTLLPTYITGVEAQLKVRNVPTISKAMIQVHQNAAMVTLVLMTITGTFAWFGLWEMRRFSRASSITSIGTLLSAATTVVMILSTASLGGKISHTEVRSELDAAITEDMGWREPIELFASEAWVWPASETLHFIGMALLFGVSLLLVLRMLGFMKSIPFSAIHRLLPLGVIGFVLNVLTGMLFFIASPGLYLLKNGFHIKIVSIVLAGIPLLYFTLFDDPWRVRGNDNASATSKIAAVCVFGLLVVVVVYGRFLPFLRQGQP